MNAFQAAYSASIWLACAVNSAAARLAASRSSSRDSRFATSLAQSLQRGRLFRQQRALLIEQGL